MGCEITSKGELTFVKPSGAEMEIDLQIADRSSGVIIRMEVKRISRRGLFDIGYRD